MFAEVPFGEWLPDLPPHRNNGALEARNVLPMLRSYGPMRTLVPFSDALATRVFSAFWAQDSSNNVNVFAGVAAALHRYQSDGTWEDVTRTSGGAYSAADWEWAKFGDFIIAVNLNDVPQVYEMGTSTDFAALAGSPPQAARVAVVRDFVVLGDLQNNPSHVRWSGFNNQTIWSGLEFQSDFQELFGRGGRVQKIIGGESGVIFTENSIWAMQYVGPPTIFRFDEVETARGTPAPNSVVKLGDRIYFYANDGFHVYANGQTQPIGYNKVDNWFRSNAGGSAYLRGAVDRINSRILWAFSTTGSSTAPFNRLLIYDVRSDRWSYAIIDTECIADLASPGYHLDNIGTILTRGIDLDSIPVDSPDYQGGALQLSAFTTNHELATFSGTPLNAVIDTDELSEGRITEGAFEGQRLFVRGARPMVHGGGTLTVAPGYRDRRTASPTFAAATATNSIGEANFRRDARYQRFRVAISGEFEHAQGCEVDLEITGRR